jgi:hypothetical protein
VTYVSDPGNVAAYSYDATPRAWKDSAGLWRTAKLASDATAAFNVVATPNVEGVTRMTPPASVLSPRNDVWNVISDRILPKAGCWVVMASMSAYMHPGSPACGLQVEVVGYTTVSTTNDGTGSTNAVSVNYKLVIPPLVVGAGTHVIVRGYTGTNAVSDARSELIAYFIPTPAYPK